MRQLMVQINALEGNQKMPSVTPLLFLMAMRQQFPQFAEARNSENPMMKGQQVYSQQDAEECFTALVNTLELSDATRAFVDKYMTG